MDCKVASANRSHRRRRKRKVGPGQIKNQKNTKSCDMEIRSVEKRIAYFWTEWKGSSVAAAGGLRDRRRGGVVRRRRRVWDSLRVRHFHAVEVRERLLVSWKGRSPSPRTDVSSVEILLIAKKRKHSCFRSRSDYKCYFWLLDGIDGFRLENKFVDCFRFRFTLTICPAYKSSHGKVIQHNMVSHFSPNFWT
jgi:hypothetical protein